jgi:hypothetical protein
MRTDDEVLSGRVPGGRARGKFYQFSCRGLPSVQQQYLTGLYSSGRSSTRAAELYQKVWSVSTTRGSVEKTAVKSTQKSYHEARWILFYPWCVWLSLILRRMSRLRGTPAGWPPAGGAGVRSIGAETKRSCIFPIHQINPKNSVQNPGRLALYSYEVPYAAAPLDHRQEPL